MASPVDFPDSLVCETKIREIVYPELTLASKVTHNLSKTKEIEAAFQGKPYCLCNVFTGLIVICQICGIFPVQFDRQSCKVSHSWASILPWVNVAWFIAIFVLSMVLLPQFVGIFYKEIQGAKFYTFAIGVVVQIISALVIYGCGNYNAIRMGKLWATLHAVSHDLIQHRLKRMKWLVLIPTVYLTIELIITFILSFYSIQTHAFGEGLTIALPIHAFLQSFVPEVIAGSYSCVLWVAALNFNALNEKLEHVLAEDNKDSDTTNSIKLARLKDQHEDICWVVRCVQDAFGVQILALFVGTSVTFVSGIYALITVSQGQVTSQLASTVLWNGVESIFLCGARVLIVILVCQRVMNSANRPAGLLNAFDDYGHSEDIMFEVETFLRKVGNFPLRMTCNNVFDLGTSFFASGTATIVTYTLILMQFKQSDA